jgi:hypothetical protein
VIEQIRISSLSACYAESLRPWARKSPDFPFDALGASRQANRTTWPNIQMPLNSALYSGYEKRKIIRKVLADEIGVTAFDVSEIGSMRGISDRVMEPHGQEPLAPLVRRNPPKLQSSFANRRRGSYGGQEATEDTRIPARPGGRGFLRRRVKAIAERIGRDHRESFPAHNFSSPKRKTLKQLAYL